MAAVGVCGDSKVRLDPLLLLHCHLHGNSLGIAETFVANFFIQNAKAFLRPDGVQDTFLCGGTTCCA
jgi:hypothetical protein